MMEQALNQTQKMYMYKAGFLIYEINAFANARTPDGINIQHLRFDSEPFQDMIHERMRYCQKLHNAGWNDMQIRSRINMLYNTKRGKASPWDFLKIEYRPPQSMTDTVWATKLKAKARIAAKLGSGYSKPMHKQTRPKYTPVTRNLPATPK